MSSKTNRVIFFPVMNFRDVPDSFMFFPEWWGQWLICKWDDYEVTTHFCPYHEEGTYVFFGTDNCVIKERSVLRARHVVGPERQQLKDCLKTRCEPEGWVFRILLEEAAEE